MSAREGPSAAVEDKQRRAGAGPHGRRSGGRRGGLCADVGELLVDPVARVAPRDDLLQALRRAALALASGAIVSAAWIESASSWMSNGLTLTRELAELLVGAGVLATGSRRRRAR